LPLHLVPPAIPTDQARQIPLGCLASGMRIADLAVRVVYKMILARWSNEPSVGESPPLSPTGANGGGVGMMDPAGLVVPGADPCGSGAASLLDHLRRMGNGTMPSQSYENSRTVGIMQVPQLSHEPVRTVPPTMQPRYTQQPSMLDLLTSGGFVGNTPMTPGTTPSMMGAVDPLSATLFVPTEDERGDM
ncbi:hypothetical protein HK101_004754, partial [Irineochytrium annulatum]